MARISTGSIVADIAGKVGDEIFSRNRQGPYVKAYASPVQPNTAKQLIARAQMVNANTRWTNLTNSEYTAYVAFAKQFSRSAFNASRKEVDPHSFFIGNGLRRQQISETAKPLPRMPINIGFTDFTLDFSDGVHMYGTWHGGVANLNYVMAIYSTLPKSLGVHSINSVQQVYFHKYDYDTEIQRDLFPNWTARFGVGFPSDTERTFISTKIIHVQSGIQVGFGWDSAIGASVAPPDTLGVTEVLPSTSTAQRTRGLPVIPLNNAILNNINVYHQGGSGNIIVGVYADSGGVPASRLFQSSVTPLNASAGFQQITVSPPLAISIGVKIWLAMVNNDNTLVAIDDAPLTVYIADVTDFIMPDPFAAGTEILFTQSIYAEVVYS